MHAHALAAYHDVPAWRDAAASVDLEAADPATPVLHRATVRLDAAAAEALLRDLASLAGSEAAGDVPALALIASSVAQREDEVAALAREADLDPAALMALGQILVRPLLLAVGDRARSMELPGWERGYCRVCGAWPLLSELRGVDRQRIARCGRCAWEWRVLHGACVFCGRDDPRDLLSIALEGTSDGRSVAACTSCQGALRSLAVLVPLDAEGLVVADLTSLDLDLIAATRGYGRPERPAIDLELSVVPA